MTSKPDTVELLPCPFCGGEAEFAGYAHEPDCYVYCGNDNCFGPRTTAGNLHDAAIQWNTRAAVRAQTTSSGLREALTRDRGERETILMYEDALGRIITEDREEHTNADGPCAKIAREAIAKSAAVPPQDSASPAEPLIQKWRRAALAIEAHALELETREEEGMSRAQADTLNDCADDLFKALFRSQEGTD